MVRDLEDDVRVRLRRRARRQRSTEREVPEILRNALRATARGESRLVALRERFAGIGLVDELPELRGEVVRTATFPP